MGSGSLELPSIRSPFFFRHCIMTANLFTPIDLGPLTLPNRLVMPALTRSRAADGDVATDITGLYYAQRASAGLIITEGSQISPSAKGYIATPGIHSDAQVAGWRIVTDAVHASGGRVFLQLWHVGRCSHPDLQPGGALPVAPSAIQPAGECYTQEGFKKLETPRALTSADIAGIVEDFRKAAQNALTAGFDGVELHGANGYLPDQFLCDKSNQRTDDYGGSIENRCRFLLEVIDALTGVCGKGRVGVRISPQNRINDVADSNPQALFNHLADQLSARGLAYLHVIEGDMTGQSKDAFDYVELKRRFGGIYIANLGYDKERADAALATGRADLIAFGRPFIANPDLVARLQLNAPLNVPDAETFYTGGEKGYVDYPGLATLKAA